MAAFSTILDMLELQLHTFAMINGVINMVVPFIIQRYHEAINSNE